MAGWRMMVKALFKRKIWTSMFLSYVLIITLCFLLYTALVVYETYMIGKERTERENAIELQEVSNAIDQRLIAAQGAVSNINASTTIKQLYMSVLSQDNTLDSYSLYAILTDLKMIRASANRIDINELVIFIDQYSKAYSCTGVLVLPEPYVKKEGISSYVEITTISEALDVQGVGNLTFSKEGLLYLADYTYSFGSSKGHVAVLFDFDILKNDITKIIGNDKSFRLMMGNKELLIIGNMEGKSYTNPSKVLGGLTVELYSKENLLSLETQQAMTLLILVGFILTVLFIIIANFFAKKYYKPIGNIKDLMTDKDMAPRQSQDEMETILTGIKDLIGERNGYREKMLTITPYMEQGMLHGMVTGNMQKESIKVLLEENYLDFQKPYFTVSVVNFFFQKQLYDYENNGQFIKDVCDKLSTIFSNEECRIYTYKKDHNNTFLIVNSDSEEPMDDLFFKIYKFIVETINNKDCMITLGIDEVKDDISQLREACERALKALDGMLINGRGEVYFYEQDLHTAKVSYYFPKNSIVKLIKLVKECKIKEIQDFFNEIYVKNLERKEITPVMIHALIDELHITTLKCMKEITGLNTIRVNIEKITTVSTLEEIFDYYNAVYKTLINELSKASAGTEDNQSLDKIILSYIDENYCNPDMSLQFLTDKFGVSSKYISLICKKQLGVTYLQYLQDKRIQHAVDLLRTTDYSLDLIGVMSGYVNSLTFRRNFKMYTGMNPSEYRSQQ